MPPATRRSLLLGACALLPLPLAAQAPPAAEQIAAAVLAAPPERRAEATVLGWDASGAVATLREGTNDLVCLADNPAEEGWSVACYHASLEPFMARGRELAAQGVSGPERSERRFAEIEAGTLPFPEEPTMLYVLHGEGFDAATGDVVSPYLRWVIYTPFATAESTGLSTTPGPGAPWLMGAGTAGAHIMITPPRPQSR